MVHITSIDDNFYSVDMMIAFLQLNKVPIINMDANKLYAELDYNVWDYYNRGSINAISPMMVIKYPKKYKHHYKRILDANLKYPIILSEQKGGRIILDGYHRLTKAYIHKLKKIKTHVLSKKVLKKFKLDYVNWEEVTNNSPEIYDLIVKYHKRFCD